MEDIEVMVLALNTMKDTLIYGKNNEALSKNAQEIINANIAELTDIIVRYCKDNYDA